MHCTMRIIISGFPLLDIIEYNSEVIYSIIIRWFIYIKRLLSSLISCHRIYLFLVLIVHHPQFSFKVKFSFKTFSHSNNHQTRDNLVEFPNKIILHLFLSMGVGQFFGRVMTGSIKIFFLKLSSEKSANHRIE